MWRGISQFKLLLTCLVVELSTIAFYLSFMLIFKLQNCISAASYFVYRDNT